MTITRRDVRLSAPSGDSGPDASVDYDCHVVEPSGMQPATAIVLASAVYGVDDDVRAIADELADAGCLVAAPDLFGDTEIPGPLAAGDPRAAERSRPRLERIAAGEAVISAARAWLSQSARWNGRSAVLGFCYGGPYAVIGPARLGFDAGIGFHSTRMDAYLDTMSGVDAPVCLLWGDEDQAAPPSSSGPISTWPNAARISRSGSSPGSATAT